MNPPRKILLEPETSVMSCESMPPVHDSAVAMLSFACVRVWTVA